MNQTLPAWLYHYAHLAKQGKDGFVRERRLYRLFRQCVNEFLEETDIQEVKAPDFTIKRMRNGSIDII